MYLTDTKKLMMIKRTIVKNIKVIYSKRPLLHIFPLGKKWHFGIFVPTKGIKKSINIVRLE